MVEIDASGLYYRELNRQIRDFLKNGEKKITLNNVNGQYYIGTGLVGDDIEIIINGVPGNDLAAFMSGPSITVNANAQDNVANTMDKGRVIISGNAGDVLGYGMRGGLLMIKGDVGYRVGIHMKGFQEQIPVLVVGGTARDFFGEYMAGGIMILLGIRENESQSVVGNYLATGMHGGVIYIRAEIDPFQCGKEVGLVEPDIDDMKIIEKYTKEYCKEFGADFNELISSKFIKIYPKSSRPYGKLYAY